MFDITTNQFAVLAVPTSHLEGPIGPATGARSESLGLGLTLADFDEFGLITGVQDGLVLEDGRALAFEGELTDDGRPLIRAYVPSADLL